MRLAEELCGPASFEELFELYGATRFLYPAKLAELAPRLGMVEDTWRRLLANDRVFKVLLRRRAEGGEVVPKNAICAWRYTTETWQAQHLVSRDRHEYTGTLAALVGLSDWLAAAPGCGSLRLTYRPENPGVQSLFQGTAESLGPERAALDILDYYLTPLERLRPPLPRSGAISSLRVDAATASSLRAFYGTRMHPALLDSLSLEDPELVGLHSAYAAHGLARGRAIFAAVHNDRIVGGVICNLASEGINFSFLENAVECLELSPGLPREMRGEVFAELMRAAAGYYRERGRDYLVALLHPTHAVLAGELLQLERQKRYAVLTAAKVNGKGFQPIRQSFIDYYRRLVEAAARSRRAAA